MDKFTKRHWVISCFFSFRGFSFLNEQPWNLQIDLSASSALFSLCSNEGPEVDGSMKSLSQTHSDGKSHVWARSPYLWCFQQSPFGISFGGASAFLVFLSLFGFTSSATPANDSPDSSSWERLCSQSSSCSVTKVLSDASKLQPSSDHLHLKVLWMQFSLKDQYIHNTRESNSQFN